MHRQIFTLTLLALSAVFETHRSLEALSVASCWTQEEPLCPGASVTIRNQETGGERHLITDAAGAYAAPSIRLAFITSP